MGSRCYFIADQIVPVCLCEIFLEGRPDHTFNRNLFQLLTGFYITPVLRISKYVILTTLHPVIVIVVALENSTTSSIFSNNPTIGCRRDHFCFIFCLPSSIYMGDIVPWSSYSCCMRPRSVRLV